MNIKNCVLHISFLIYFLLRENKKINNNVLPTESGRQLEQTNRCLLKNEYF